MLTKLPLFPPSSLFFFKAIDTGVILLADKVATVIVVKEISSLILARLKDFYQFTKPLNEFELPPGALLVAAFNSGTLFQNAQNFF